MTAGVAYAKVEKTFAMIKPDAVKTKVAGKIISMIEENDFEITAIKKMTFTKSDAETFYSVHKGKPFFDGLVEFMTSGPIFAIALERDNAIAEWRKLMGATNHLEAAEGTVRKLYATSIRHNAVHGSDAEETAKEELKQIFPDL
ncbi:nucleoside-diphosphate kinase [bacterium]|nr:nucleoside-diphosphate kinase [bacterium]